MHHSLHLYPVAVREPCRVRGPGREGRPWSVTTHERGVPVLYSVVAAYIRPAVIRRASPRAAACWPAVKPHVILIGHATERLIELES